MIKPMKIWKPVLGFESNYEVSSDGEVRRISKGGAARVGHILANQIDKQGYVRLKLSLNSVPYPRKIHRLVAESFFGPIAPGLTVNHKNGIKHDNRAENLEVVTRGANIQHAFKVIKTQNVRGEKNPRARFSESDILDIRRRLSNGDTLTNLAKDYNSHKATMHCIKTRKTWAHI